MLHFMPGGWKVEPAVGTMPEKVASAFAEKVGKLVGVVYTPLIYCGSQVVNGTNHMILCMGETRADQPAKFISKIVLNEDLEGGTFNLQLIEQITPNAVEGVNGSWVFTPSAEDLPEQAKKALTKVFNDLDGGKYEMLLYCGSQTVSGTNYMFICKGTSIPDPASETEQPPVSFIVKLVILTTSDDKISMTIERII